MPITPKTGSLFHAESQRQGELVAKAVRFSPGVGSVVMNVKDRFAKLTWQQRTSCAKMLAEFVFV